MRIELNKKQFKTLLTIMYCGEWMLNCDKIRLDKLYKETEELEQIIFSFAREAKLEKWIEYDERLNMYFPTADMEDALDKYIDRYDRAPK